MILTQALAFVIPSILAGYICACPTIYLIERNVFNATQEDSTFFPAITATLFAVAIGLVIPMISALIPIRSALMVTLVESLNTARSSVSGTVVHI